MTKKELLDLLSPFKDEDEILIVEDGDFDWEEYPITGSTTWEYNNKTYLLINIDRAAFDIEID